MPTVIFSEDSLKIAKFYVYFQSQLHVLFVLSLNWQMDRQIGDFHGHICPGVTKNRLL